MKPSAVTILALLLHRGEQGATALDGWRVAHTNRMAARVAELRAAGHAITTTYETTDGVRYARYVLHR